MRLLFILLLCITSLQAQKREVGANKPYKTIKQALNASKDGDTVLVHKGIYKEGNIRIDKKIVFLGKDFPVLDGQKKVEVLSVHSDSVIVKGFRVINSGFAALEDPCGIKVYNKSFVLIEGNQLDDNFFGIYIQNGRNYFYYCITYLFRSTTLLCFLWCWLFNIIES